MKARWRGLLGLAKLAGVLLLLVAGLTLVESQLGQPMGLFAGFRPTNLGFTAGKFTPCSWKPNCVSSTADRSDLEHFVEPFALGGPTKVDWAKLRALIDTFPNAKVVSESPGYLHAEFKTAGLGFVDDLELALDAKQGVIHVRSASRLGIRDFGVNRQRVEDLRQRLARK